MAVKPSTVEDVRLTAAACELARCVHAMRLAAFPELPAKEWMDLSVNDKQMFVDHSAALLGRLAPIVKQKPALSLVEKL